METCLSGVTSPDIGSRQEGSDKCRKLRCHGGRG
jgi:hypothetical protein